MGWSFERTDVFMKNDAVNMIAPFPKVLPSASPLATMMLHNYPFEQEGMENIPCFCYICGLL